MNDMDLLIHELLEAAPEGLRRDQLADASGLEAEAVKRSLDRLRGHGAVYNNNAELPQGRGQRAWFARPIGLPEARRLVVPAAHCQPCERRVPYSVFHLAQVGA